ncbi:MAG TPA: ParB/RepB/Spo0J family partition protein [Spirochaetota bacterium]|nr:ParB/RepB/Spo0J family partition protein [Spirochaetota bacterium]
MAKKVLGKGLGAIITTSPTPASDFEKVLLQDKDRIVDIPVASIMPNPEQPRVHFDQAEIAGLAQSIQHVGLLQPIIVRKQGDEYFIVAGERRWRACKLLGKPTIRAIVMNTSEEQNLTLALIENIQRTNLDPIEEAKAYKILSTQFKLKQSEISDRVGKDRATVANILRLLNLPEHMQEALQDGKINVGHAKLLLSVSMEEQEALYEKIINQGLSVRDVERAIADVSKSSIKKKKKAKDAHLRKLEEELISFLGTRVAIHHSAGKGRIEISFYSLEDFDRIVSIIKGER